MNHLKQVIKTLLRGLRLLPESNDRLYAGLDIGPNTYYVRQNLDGVAPRLISLGRDCVLAPTAMILTHDASSFIHTGRYRFAPVKIGDRCFLGYNSVIMPGVTIGSDVIVGAGAVVTSDVPDGMVMGGVPARVIGNTLDVMNKWEHELIEPPFPFGVFPSPDHLLELQQKAVAMYNKKDK